MQIPKGPRKSVFELAFSPDGRWLAVGGHQYVSLWDLTSGAVVHTWTLREYCTVLAFSPDHRMLAAVDRQPGLDGSAELLIWGIAAPETPILRGAEGGDYLWFHPDSSWLLVQGDDTQLTRWDTTTWASRVLWESRQGWTGRQYCQVVVSPDTRFLIRQRRQSIGGVGCQDVVEFYDLRSGELVRTTHLPGLSRSRAFLPDGRHVVEIQKHHLLILDLAEGKEVLRRESGRKRFHHLAVSPDGRCVLTAPAGKAVQRWDTDCWRETQTYTWSVGEICCLAAAPDGQRAAAGGSSGQVVVWDLD